MTLTTFCLLYRAGLGQHTLALPESNGMHITLPGELTSEAVYKHSSREMELLLHTDLYATG